MFSVRSFRFPYLFEEHHGYLYLVQSLKGADAIFEKWASSGEDWVVEEEEGPLGEDLRARLLSIREGLASDEEKLEFVLRYGESDLAEEGFCTKQILTVLD